MGNPSAAASTENNNITNETDHISVEISEYEKICPRILHRVPPQLRENKKHIYDPVVISLGLYHHDKSQKFHQVEDFKNEVLDVTLEPSIRVLFRRMILNRVDEIRIFYGAGVSIDEYEDEELAEMMLRDSCFVLYYMEMMTGNMEKARKFLRQLGLSVAVVLFRDMFMLENQIPLWVIKFLISMKFDDKDEGEALLYKFLSSMNFMDYRLTRVPWEDKDQEPLHLLEALRSTALKGDTRSTIEVQRRRIFEFNLWNTKNKKKKKNVHSRIFEKANSPFRSVTDLKTKGIHFKPSSNSLTDIRFNSYWFYGVLQLPIRYITDNSQVFFSNVIALEMSPENDYLDFAMISYVNFMKSLIESPKDVKELRENGILFSSLRNDEEVVKMFKEIDTYGIDNADGFQEVKMRINEHCKSKAKTWTAELFLTKFRTPWTVIALVAAIFLLCLTFLQTYYTMNPRSGN